MNNQEAFDKVCIHLFTQRKRAMRGLECVYRAPDGSKCAVGCLIPDSEYREAMEGRSVDAIYPVLPSLHGVSDLLLEALQRRHDNKAWWHSPQMMSSTLKGVATQFGLSAEVLTDELVGSEW